MSICPTWVQLTFGLAKGDAADPFRKLQGVPNREGAATYYGQYGRRNRRSLCDPKDIIAERIDVERPHNRGHSSVEIIHRGTLLTIRQAIPNDNVSGPCGRPGRPKVYVCAQCPAENIQTSVRISFVIDPEFGPRNTRQRVTVDYEKV